MTLVEQFKDLNPPIDLYESVDFSAVKKALRSNLHWEFLPMAAQNVISRNSLGTLEVFNFLHVYKFATVEEILEMINHALHFDMKYLTSVKIPDSLQELSQKLDVLLERDPNGVDIHVYMGLHKMQSEATLSVELVGRQMIFHYLLPNNYDLLRNPDLMEYYEWDYHSLFNRYLYYCVTNGATDFHFDIAHFDKKPVYRSLVRIGPDREVCDLFKITQRMNVEMIRSIITDRSSNKGAVLDLDNNRGVITNLKDVFGDGSLDIRFEASRVLDGYMCVCRLQELKTVSFTIEELGFDPETVQLLKENTQRPSGLTLFTGKIRTGKNTTMSAVANEIVERDNMPALISFDDPVEILGKYPQVDYRGDVEALKSYIRLAKKQDLDFCLLNEIPNAEVAFGVRDLTNSSIHTMTTWHMNRLWHLPHKLFEYFGEAYRDMLSQMNLVCNQRLYKQQCSACLKEIHRQTFSEEKRIYNFFVDHDLQFARVAEGCAECGYLGFDKKKIVVLPEVLKFTHDLVLELFEANRPYEMEKVIMKWVKGSQFSLELQMKAALEDGRLHPSDVLSII